jgi:hypothetical protein
MAKNTGRGTRAAANSPTSGQFLQAKTLGGAFKGIQDERSWTARHPAMATLLVAALVVAVFIVVLAVANLIPAALR